MAHTMSMKMHAFKAGAAPRPARGAARAPVAVHASKQEVSVAERIAPALLAGIVAFTGLNTVDAVYAPIARADDEEFMTPYQKRQAEMERRRELLREAREKAAARASGADVDTPATPAAPAEPAKAEPAKPASDFSSQAARLKKESLKAYEDAAKNRPAVPATPAAAEPEPEPQVSAPRFGGFSFSKPQPAEAPAPAAAPEPAKPAAPAPFKPAVPVPVPVPVPTPAPAPAKKVEEKKVEQQKPAPAPAAAANKKRRGPLPLWFAEILVLGAYVGMGLAATKYSAQSEKVLKVAGGKIVGAYTAAEKFVADRTRKTA